MRDDTDEYVEAWVRELPHLDPIKEQILTRMASIVRHVSEARSSGAQRGGLLMWQYKTLLMLRKQGAPFEMSPSALAESVGLTRGATSTRLRTLEELGMIRRVHDTVDRRRVTVALTSAGRDVVEACLQQEEQRERSILAGLSADQQRALADLLRVITARTEGHA